MKLFMITLIFTLLSISPVRSDEDDKGRSHETFPIQLKIDATEYKATVYVPKNTSIKAMLILTPSIEGVTAMETSNAAYFSKRGYVVIVPESFLNEMMKHEPDTEKINADYYKPVVSTIGFINHVDYKLKLSPNLPVFALGSSQGGIISMLLTSHIPRITGAWAIVAGGDLPYIYAHSDVSQLVKFRINHMKFLKIRDNDDYEAYLRLYLKNDPAISCKDIRVPFHQTIATRDTSVPTKTQELLVKECPPHSVSRHPLNHTSGALTAIRDRQEIIAYFDDLI